MEKMSEILFNLSMKRLRRISFITIIKYKNTDTMKEGPCESPLTPLLIARVKNYLNWVFITMWGEPKWRG